MNALSSDLRRRIVDHYKAVEGATLDSTSQHFSVGRSTVKRLLKLFRETNSITPKPQRIRNGYKIDRVWLSNKVSLLSDFTLKDLVLAYEKETAIKISIPAIWFALKRIGWSHKKNGIFQRKRV